MESVSHAGCVIGILAPGDAGSELGKELATVSARVEQRCSRVTTHCLHGLGDKRLMPQTSLFSSSFLASSSRIATSQPSQAEKKEDSIAVVGGENVDKRDGEDVAMDDATPSTAGAGAGSGTAAPSSSSAAEAAPAASTSVSPPKGKKRQGVVLAAEKKVTSKLLDKAGGGPDEKVFVVNE